MTIDDAAIERALPLFERVSLGATLQGDGVDVTVLAGHASAVYVCFFSGERGNFTERRVALHRGLYGLWSGHVPGVQEGDLYGIRADGPWAPHEGLRYNVNKVLLDPYARAISEPPVLNETIFSQKVDENLKSLPGMEMSTSDSADSAALGVITASPAISEPSRDQQLAPKGPRVPWNRTVIYETHVSGLTKQLTAIPEELRGTYAGMAHPATIEHLKRLGVTSIELLPIHANFAEPFLIQKGLTNYWGYNTLNFFAPEPRYASAAAREAGPIAVVEEVKQMVASLHEAGLEVLLDVVYNHTCEAGVDGPTLSFRGLDHTRYYRHNSFQPGLLKDTTGCGNSLDFRETPVIGLTLDSLRYWVSEIGVDGFRFDLAVTLGREGDHFNTNHAFYHALATDPVLRGVKLINEPWDVGPNGWQTGKFLAPTTDWNDLFRDSLRTFWLTSAASMVHGGSSTDLRDLATRIAGSADLFGLGRTPEGRGVRSSINFVTAHDGFSLWDLVSYNHKHNEANQEQNHDGSDNNKSWNHGFEGDAGLDEMGVGGDVIRAKRRRSARNLLGTLALAAGTPMLRSGDEFLKTQHGNNNAYCLDTPLTWIDWDVNQDQQNFYDTLAYLLRLRREHPVLRPRRFYTGTPRPGDTMRDLEWFDAGGHHMPDYKWFDSSVRVLQMLRSGSHLRFMVDANEQEDSDALLIFNGTWDSAPIAFPTGRGRDYQLAWSSAWERPEDGLVDGELQTFSPGGAWVMPAMSLAVFFA